MTAIAPFLMFEGKAEEAVRFYVSIFEGSVESIEYQDTGEPGGESSVKQIRFTLHGQNFLCIDSPMPHSFTFTPSISFFITCDSEAEVDRLFAALSDGGEILMPLDAYPFSRRYGWVNDRFGISWQLSVG